MIPVVNQPFHAIEILSRGSSGLNEAADVFAHAFMFGNPDPVNKDSKGLPDPLYDRYNNGEQEMREFFRSVIRLVNEIGHTISVVKNEHDEVVGASWVKGRGVRDLSFVDFPKLIWPCYRAFGLLGSIIYAVDIFRHIPIYPEGTTYISMIGVTTPRKGICKALVENAVKKAEAKDVVLCTMNPNNVAIYSHLGFVLMPEKTTQCSDFLYRRGFTTYRKGFTTYNMTYKAKAE